MTITNIPHLSVKRPNGYEYWFNVSEGENYLKISRIEKLEIQDLNTYMENMKLQLAKVFAVNTPVEEPDLETAALAVVTLKALSTSTEIPVELIGALEQLTNGVKQDSKSDPDLGESATVTATKLIDRLEAKGSFDLAAQIKQALAYVSTINGGKI